MTGAARFSCSSSLPVTRLYQKGPELRFFPWSCKFLFSKELLFFLPGIYYKAVGGEAGNGHEMIHLIKIKTVIHKHDDRKPKPDVLPEVFQAAAILHGLHPLCAGVKDHIKVQGPPGRPAIDFLRDIFRRDPYSPVVQNTGKG